MNQASSTLVIGSTGMLGRAVVQELATRGLPFTAFDREHLDLRDHARIAQVPATFTHIINCAGYTDVDQAEQNEELATQLNGSAIAALAKRCLATGAVLVHFSSDYVFNGLETAPYRTEHRREPINAYGRSKAIGEEALESSGAKFLCVRTSWLYAPWGKNFALTMMHLLGKKTALRVVNDQRGRPTSCSQLARVTLNLLDSEATGIFHVTDSGECTWFGFAEEIKRQLGHHCRVESCSSAEHIRPAKRPGYSVLDLSKTEEITGKLPNWKENLRAVLNCASAATNRS